MKTQKYLAEKAMQLIAFFSSITGMVTTMIVLLLVDSAMNAFAVGKIFGVRMNNYTESNVHWWSFGFAFVITLGLGVSIIVASLSHRIKEAELEGASKQIAKMKNQDLSSLANTLCNFSVVISLMAVGVFMFDKVTFEGLKQLATTPLFYTQIILFLCIAIGVPKTVSRFAKFIYIKYYSIIDKLNEKIGESIHDMIDDYFEEEKPERKASGKVIDFSKFKRKAS